MTFDRQKLFFGMMDFLSILLPGALLTLLLADQAEPAVLGEGRFERLAEREHEAAQQHSEG